MSNQLRTRRSRTAGYTLVELLVVLLLMGIAVSLAAPSMRGVMPERRVSGTLDKISGDLMYARMEAIRSGQPAALVFTSPSSYVVRRYPVGAEPILLKSVDLASDFRRASVLPPCRTSFVVDSVQFDSRGIAPLPSCAPKSIRATDGAVTDSIIVTGIGRVIRVY